MRIGSARRVYVAAPRRGAMLKDYWTRAFAGGPSSIRASDGQPFKNFDAFWRRALHDGFINGTSIADGGPATPFVAEPRAASPAGTAAAAAAVHPPARPTARLPASDARRPPPPRQRQRRRPGAQGDSS